MNYFLGYFFLYMHFAENNEDVSMLRKISMGHLGILQATRCAKLSNFVWIVNKKKNTFR